MNYELSSFYGPIEDLVVFNEWDTTATSFFSSSTHIIKRHPGIETGFTVQDRQRRLGEYCVIDVLSLSCVYISPIRVQASDRRQRNLDLSCCPVWLPISSAKFEVLFSMPPQAAQPADAGESQSGLSVRSGHWDFACLLAVNADQVLGNDEIGTPRYSRVHARTIRHVSVLWKQRRKLEHLRTACRSPGPCFP